MNSEAIHDESIFQQAIATVEALSVEDQTILIEIIQNRLRQKSRRYYRATHHSNNHSNNFLLLPINYGDKQARHG